MTSRRTPQNPLRSPAASAAARQHRFTHNGIMNNEGPAELVDDEGPTPPGRRPAWTEALAGFDNLTNGLIDQGPGFETLDEHSVVPFRSFNDDRFLFEEVEHAEDGLGPTYNAQSCRECHQNMATGGASQIVEHRTGHMTDGMFFESQGGSLVQSRATEAEAMELVVFQDDIRTFRLSTNTLGDGYVEAVSNSTLLAIRDREPASMRGTAVLVPVLEAGGDARVGRFGWKSQHGSLQSFAADAYLSEMGITSPLLPDENTSSGRDVSAYDHVADPEDDGTDVLAFAEFMRATKAPPRGPITDDVRAGERVFRNVGCATCHVPSLGTAAPGTAINGGQFIVPPALGHKVFHPYSDYLLHDIGPGDGIPIQPTPEYAATANQIRTAPLWGLRTRNRLMHDGLAFTREEAIARHGGQATASRAAYQALGARMKQLLLAFLDSL